MIWFAHAFTAAVVGAAPPPSDVATAVYLTDYPGAKCLDGSPYAYYIRPAPAHSPNASKWVFHL